MRRACTKEDNLVLSTTEKGFESTAVIQSTYPDMWYGANWSTVSPKKPQKQSPCLVKRMRKISLIYAEGKHHSPILGICFSHAVFKEQGLFSDDECLWHKSLASEPSLIQEVEDTELSFQLPHTSWLHSLRVSHVWSLEGVAPWA